MFVELEFSDRPAAAVGAWYRALSDIHLTPSVPVVVALGPPPFPTLETLVWAAARAQLPVIAWLDTDAWLPLPIPSPQLPSPATPLPISDSPLRTCPPSVVCSLCARVDALFTLAPEGIPHLSQQAWAAVLLRQDTNWWPHQVPPPAIPIPEDSLPRCGPPSPREEHAASLLRLLLARVASSPPPPTSRLRLPPDVECDGPEGDRGVVLQWLSEVRPQSVVESFVPPHHTDIISSTILKAVAAGHWEFCDPSDIEAASLVFCEPKRKRMCVDPSEVNDLTPDPSVQYGDVADLLAFPSQWLTKIDLKDAFPHIPLSPADRRYWGAVLVFSDGTRWYLRLRVLWFGYSRSPRLFVHTLERTVAHLRPHSHAPEYGSHVQYVDDSVMSRDTWLASVWSSLSALVALIWDGWWPSVSKCFWWPCSTIKALGLCVDSPRQVLTVAPSSVLNFTEELDWLRAAVTPPPSRLASPHLSMLSRLLGKLSFYSRALPFLSFLRVHANKVLYSGTFTASASSELDHLSALAPSFPSRFSPSAPSLPVLVVIADGSKQPGCAPTGGFFWLLVGAAGVILHSLHSISFRDFPHYDISSSAALEMATVAVAVSQANLCGLSFASVAVFGDSQAALASVSRLRVRAPRSAAVLAHLYDALWCPRLAVQRPIAASWTRRSWPSAVLADSLSDAVADLVRFPLITRQTLQCLAGPFDEDFVSSSAAVALAPRYALPGGAGTRRGVLSKFLSAAASQGAVCPLLPPSLFLDGRLVVVWQSACRPWSDLLRGLSPISVVVVRYAGCPPPSWERALGPPADVAFILPPDRSAPLPWLVLAWGTPPPMTECPHLSLPGTIGPVAFLDGGWWRRCPCLRLALPPGAAASLSLEAIHRVLSRSRHAPSPLLGEPTPLDPLVPSSMFGGGDDERGYTSRRTPRFSWVPTAPSSGALAPRLRSALRSSVSSGAPLTHARSVSFTLPSRLRRHSRRLRRSTRRSTRSPRRPFPVITFSSRRTASVLLPWFPPGSLHPPTPLEIPLLFASVAFTLQLPPDPPVPIERFGGGDEERGYTAPPPRIPPRRRARHPLPASRSGPPLGLPRHRRPRSDSVASGGTADLDDLLADYDAGRRHPASPRSDDEWLTQSATPTPPTSPDGPSLPPAASAAAAASIPSPVPRRPLFPTSAYHGLPFSALAGAPSPPSSSSTFSPSSSGTSSSHRSLSSPPSAQSVAPPRIPPSRSLSAPVVGRKRPRPSSSLQQRPAAPFFRRVPPQSVPLPPAAPTVAETVLLADSSPDPSPAEISRADPHPPPSLSTRWWVSPRGDMLPTQPLLPLSLPSLSPPTPAERSLSPLSPPMELWEHMSCRGCERDIPPTAEARFCDVPECVFVSCRRCAPASRDDSPLFCPRHQLLRVPPPEPTGGPVAALRSSVPDTLGRLVSRLWAKSSPPLVQASLSDFPLLQSDGSWSHVARAASDAMLAAWCDTKRRALLGPARRLFAFFALEGLLLAPLSTLPAVLLLYAKARLLRPLEGWSPTTAPSLHGEMSRIAASLREDHASVGEVCGPQVRAFLLSHGSSQRPQHSKKLPVLLSDLVPLFDRNLDPTDLLTLKACIVQSYYALRPGYVSRLRRSDFHPVAGGHLLSWQSGHKTRRVSHAPNLPPQSSVARGPMLDAALSHASGDSLLFPLTTASVITVFLRRFLPSPPPGFTLSAHSLRVGTDTALQALALPDDIIAAWGWWSRVRRMTAYYGAISVLVCLVASELMVLVRIRAVTPGWFEPVFIPPLPDWARLRSTDTTATPTPAPVGFPPVSSSDEDPPLVIPVPALPPSVQLHPPRHRRPGPRS